jgi:hypothetical protein
MVPMFGCINAICNRHHVVLKLDLKRPMTISTMLSSLTATVLQTQIWRVSKNAFIFTTATLERAWLSTGLAIRGPTLSVGHTVLGVSQHIAVDAKLLDSIIPRAC